jgi:hypothetical protein
MCVWLLIGKKDSINIIFGDVQVKKLSTVLLALSMLFGSDVDARRAPGAKAGKKGIKANKGVQFSSENLVQKVLELSAGEKSDLEALSNVAKTLSEMVEKNPGILTQVQNIVKETETVKQTIEGKKGKGKKGKKVSFKKSAAKLASAFGKLISAQNLNDVDAATAENAPAKFDALLKNSKLIAEVNKEIDLSDKFRAGLKFDSEKLVKDLNAALTEKDETKKFEALKALFASLDSQYATLTAPVLSDADVVSKVQSLYLQDSKFQGTAKLADLNAAVEAFRAAYVAASDAVKGTMCAGLKAVEAEKVASDKIAARVEYLRDNGTYTSSDAQASASVYSVVKKLFDQPTADLYKNSLKASKGAIAEAQVIEFNDFVNQLQGCVEDVQDNMGNKTGLRLTSDTVKSLTSDERAALDSFIQGSTFADLRQEFTSAMATLAVTGYNNAYAAADVGDLGKLAAGGAGFANQIQNLKETFGYTPTKSKKTKVGEYKPGDMLVGNTTVVELIKRCSAAAAAGGLDINALKQEQAVKDHFQNRTNKINQFATNVQTWMRDLEIFPARNAHAGVARAVQASRQIGGRLFYAAINQDRSDLARETLVSIFDCVINKRPVTELANNAPSGAGRPAVTALQYEVAVKKTKQLLEIIRG